MKKVICPHCGYKMPICYDESARARGLFVKCKGRQCGKIFEIIIDSKHKDERCD